MPEPKGEQRADLSGLELPMVPLCFETGKPNSIYNSVTGSSQEFHDCAGGSGGRSPNMPIAQPLAVHV